MAENFNLKTFRSAIHHIGRNQYFQIQIPDIGSYDILTALCRSTTMPPKTHETIDVYYRGLPMKIDGRATFDAWNVTFLSDEGQTLRNIMMSWMEKAYNVSNLENLTHIQYKADNVSVSKLAANKQIVSGVTFFGIWPTQVGEVELNQEGGSVETFEVTFSYDFWLMTDAKAPEQAKITGDDITATHGIQAGAEFKQPIRSLKDFTPKS
jgi:hypothetical protein